MLYRQTILSRPQKYFISVSEFLNLSLHFKHLGENMGASGVRVVLIKNFKV